MTGQLCAYHGDPAIKLKYVGRVRAHQDADELVRGAYWKDGKGGPLTESRFPSVIRVRGAYWKDGKGGAVGCTVHSGDHAAYETDLGMPKWLAYLEDRIFEGMSNVASRRFPLRLFSAIPVGFAAWDSLHHEFCAYLLRDVCEFDRAEDTATAAAVDAVIHLHERWTEADDQVWKAAESAAYSAAYSATRSAAWLTAGVAAMSARSADLGSMVAGWLATPSLAWFAWVAPQTVWSARLKSYDRMGDWLVEWFAAASEVPT